MNKLIAGVAAGAAFMASSAFATPVYTGDTYADFSLNPPLPTASGYYIWSNEERTSWSVRWTGNNNGSTQWGQWFGSIEFGGLEVGGVSEVQFESGHSDEVNLFDFDIPGISDVITYTGYAGPLWDAAWDVSFMLFRAGPLWDGFDFTIDSAIAGEVIGFNLGSTLFSLDTIGEQESMGIFVGQDYASVNVLVQGTTDSSGRTQNFEISVPEPGSLALFSLGILGLGLSRRKAS